MASNLPKFFPVNIYKYNEITELLMADLPKFSFMGIVYQNFCPPNFPTYDITNFSVTKMGMSTYALAGFDGKRTCFQSAKQLSSHYGVTF